MKIKKIDLNNFRQFYGEQSLTISASNEKNVTLIHAQNGVGKTTILNSILWAFYNTTTKKFEDPDQIINFEARKDGSSSASVGLLFEHDGADYYAQRWHTSDNNNRASQTLRVHEVKGGNYRPLQAPDEFINSVMPRGMAPYFFFDGEHAETFGSEHHHREVNRAIRNILGCNLAEQAIGDLSEIQKKLRREIGSTPDADDLEKANNKLEELDLKIATLHKRIHQAEDNKSSYEETASQLRKELSQFRESAEKQKRRDDKSHRLKKVVAARNRADQKKLAWPGKHALPLVSQRLASTVLQYVDEQSVKGRIPSPYNENFVHELLEEERCICGRSLPMESEEWKKVYGLLENAGNAQILDRVTQAKSEARSLQRGYQDALSALNEIEREINSHIDDEQQLEQEVGQLSQEIADLPVEEIQEKEKALARAEENIKETVGRIGGYRHQVQELEKEYKAVELEMNRIAQQNTKVKPLIQRRDLAAQVANYIEQQLSSHEVGARTIIKQKVSEILEKTTRRNYQFWLGDDYRMELLYPDGRAVPRSGGENQLMSLAFISALVAFAKMRATAQGEILIPGLVGPLVLDSPFGQLDDIYRRATAEFVPELAEQVVVLVSRGQGDESVLDALERRVGEQYVLTSENAGERGSKPDEHVVLEGARWPLSAFNCDRDMTRVTQVTA